MSAMHCMRYELSLFSVSVSCYVLYFYNQKIQFQVKLSMDAVLGLCSMYTYCILLL
jgi:hypothetical protein